MNEVTNSNDYSSIMDENINVTEGVNNEIKVSRKRYLVLLIFCLLSATNSFQWIQYSIISDVVQEYYNVPSIYVDSTSVIFMIVYIPLIFPAMYILSRFGLRKTLLIASFGNFIGSVIKCFSIQRNLFYVTFIGQTISGISQVFILNIPPHLSSVWFPKDEVSTATAVGVFGNQVGIAFGFIIPTYLVTKSDYMSHVANRLSILFMGTAFICLISFVLILYLFDDKPKYSPSLASQTRQQSETPKYSASLTKLFKNKSFICLLLSFGIESGVLYSISTLLNQIVSNTFAGHSQIAGDMGLIATIAGIIGATLGGLILDKYHQYLIVTLITYFFCIVSTAALIGLIKLNPLIYPMYIGAFIFGFFLTGYLPIGYEFGAEITFPEPEGTSAGLLNTSAQIFGIIMTYVSSSLIDSFGVNYMLIFCCLSLVIGFILMLITKFELKRFNVEKGDNLLT